MKTVHRCLLACSLILASTPAVWSQSLPEKYAKPLPQIAALAKPDFEKATASYEITPFGDASLAYTFRLPKDWTEAKDMTDQPLAPKILTDLSRFYSPPSLEALSTFIVQGLKLEYAQTAEQWFIQYMVANGYTVEGMKTHGKTRAEALYVAVAGDESYIIRAVLEINGKHALLAQFRMPVELWDAHKQMQAQVIDSFRVKNPVNESVEEMKDYRFLDVAQVKYPVSWKMRTSPIKSTEVMGLDLFNTGAPDQYNIKKRALNGKISVVLNAMNEEETLEQKISGLKSSMEGAGLVFKDAVEEKERPEFNASAEKPEFAIYKASFAKNPQLDYEVWISTFKNRNYFYALTLETPSRDKDYASWVRNIETYKIVLKSLAPSQ